MVSIITELMGSAHRLIAGVVNNRRSLSLFALSYLLLLVLTTLIYGLLIPTTTGVRLPGTGEVVRLGWNDASIHALCFLLAFLTSLIGSYWSLLLLYRQWQKKLIGPRLFLVVLLSFTPYLLSRMLLVIPELKAVADLLSLAGFFIYLWLLRTVFQQRELLVLSRVVIATLSMVLIFSISSLFFEILMGY